METVLQPWLEKYPKEIPSSLTYEERPLHDYLKEASEKYPEKKALHFLGKEMTYLEVYHDALRMANYLKKIGVKKGDRVAIMLPNSPQAVIGYYGVLMAGGIVVQTNPMYVERELEHQLNDSGATFILCLDLLYNKVKNVKDKTPLKHILVTSIPEYLTFPKNILAKWLQKPKPPTITKGENIHFFKDIIKSSPVQEIEMEISPKEDLALLQYTGGTTGLAKGVMLTHYNLVVNTTMCLNWMYKSKKGEERILAILPFFHVFGMTVVMNFSVMIGAKMIIVPKFDPKQVLKTIDKEKPTIFPGAPTIYIALLNHPELSKYDLSSIDACISGSAPLPVEVQDKFEKLTGGKLVEGYGLSETSPCTHSNFIWENRVRGSIGVPWPDTDATILSLEDGNPLPPNQVGEIAIKGPQVMKGYWNLPEETQATFREDWFLTGDLGYMDDQGYFYVVDRKKDMVIAGGFNIYPREIEEVLYEHDKILEAVCAGIPDPYRGETVKAYIVLKEGEECTEEELNNFCREHLASYKVPHKFEFRKELPKTAVGKILRRALVEEEKEKQQS